MMRLRGRPRPEGPGQALLPVRHRRGGFHQGPLHPGGDPAGPRVRQRIRPLERQRPPCPRLRARQRGHQDGCAPWHRSLLLPAQDGARGPGLRRPDGHLHDFQHHGRVAHPARLRPGRRRGRRAGPPRRGLRPQPRPVRRERQEPGQLHLQLLRLLLRSDDRRSAGSASSIPSTPRTSCPPSTRDPARAAASAPPSAPSKR